MLKHTIFIPPPPADAGALLRKQDGALRTYQDAELRAGSGGRQGQLHRAGDRQDKVRLCGESRLKAESCGILLGDLAKNALAPFLNVFNNFLLWPCVILSVVVLFHL